MADERHLYNDEEQWFSIRTKPKCEDLTSTNLAMKNIIVFNPKIEEVWHRSKKIAPLFPGYIFANFSLHSDYYKVVWTTGVKQILGYGRRPVAVEPEIVYLIMDRITNAKYIEPKFRRGDPVRVKDGAFSELIGLFETYCPRRERIKVLLRLFNQNLEVEMDPDNIEKIGFAHNMSWT